MHAFTNKLISETSPYLLQHAHNPVNWFAWGEEALQKAIEEDKPILVSIGYSACHWCHVMERESFENEETAKLMNENFINIKIDREERPDLDHIYMDAVQAISGSGGWPLNVFLTPAKKPFYGGTYFPPQRAFNRASWKEVLTGVAQLYKDKRQEVETQADELIKHIEQSGSLFNKKDIINIEQQEVFMREECDDIFINIIKQADKKWGGFGNAPKFPQTFTINYLLRYYHYTKNEEALQHALLSLDKMLQGGIYDQLGGGFARYSTDSEWLAPHFEKMLYDNALIISSLCDAYQITKKEEYKKTIEHTLNFLIRELTPARMTRSDGDEEGGFYAALDADSEGVEGKFYVWSYDEVNEILKDDAELFCEYYDVSQDGNWEHTNILRVFVPLNEFAQKKNINVNKLEEILSSSAKKLLQQRGKRIRPMLDDKILLSWNAMMTTALCKASAAFNNSEYKKIAIRNFEFLFSKFKADEKTFELYHTYKNGIAKYPAFLDDYGCMIESCIHLQEITSEEKYLEYAKSFTEYVLENFSSEKEDFFYFTNKNQKDIVVRKIEIYDNAVASGNSLMAKNLMYLSLVFNKPEWRKKAFAGLQNLSGIIIKHPTSFGNWACSFIDVAAEINEIAIIGKDMEKSRTELLQYFIPNKILQSHKTGNEAYPLLSGKIISDDTLIYLCKNYTCLSPVKNVSQLVNQTIKGLKFN